MCRYCQLPRINLLKGRTPQTMSGRNLSTIQIRCAGENMEQSIPKIPVTHRYKVANAKPRLYIRSKPSTVRWTTKGLLVVDKMSAATLLLTEKHSYQTPHATPPFTSPNGTETRAVVMRPVCRKDGGTDLRGSRLADRRGNLNLRRRRGSQEGRPQTRLASRLLLLFSSLPAQTRRLIDDVVPPPPPPSLVGNAPPPCTLVATRTSAEVTSRSLAVCINDRAHT